MRKANAYLTLGLIGLAITGAAHLLLAISHANYGPLMTFVWVFYAAGLLFTFLGFALPGKKAGKKKAA